MIRFNEDKWWKIRESARQSKNVIKRGWSTICYKLILKFNCSGIPLNTKFRGKPVLPHGLSGIWISRGAVIGENCVIFQQVTIGSNTLVGSNNIGAPIIGNNCYIGVGAKIIGNIKIGNNVRIGANCVVIEDIPDNTTVVLQKPRVIHKDKKNENNFVPFL